MTHIAKLVKVSVVISFVAVFVCGCQRFRNNKEEEIKLTGSDLKKTQLLTQIDRKFESPEAHYELGKIYLINGLWEKALWHFDVALRFSPVHWPAEAAIVKTLLASGKDDRAALAAERCISRARASAEASVILGQAFQAEDLGEYALACYRQALDLAPNSAALHKQIGYYYLGKGDMALAEQYLKQCFRLNPYQPEVAGELGRLGVIVEVPRRQGEKTNKLDKIINQKRDK